MYVSVPVALELRINFDDVLRTLRKLGDLIDQHPHQVKVFLHSLTDPMRIFSVEASPTLDSVMYIQLSSSDYFTKFVKDLREA